MVKNKENLTENPQKRRKLENSVTKTLEKRIKKESSFILICWGGEDGRLEDSKRKDREGFHHIKCYEVDRDSYPYRKYLGMGIQ